MINVATLGTHDEHLGDGTERLRLKGGRLRARLKVAPRQEVSKTR
jgi:hypothetical protein